MVARLIRSMDAVLVSKPAVAGAALTRHWSSWIVLALILILGAKLYQIGLAGDPLPYWDQWDAEGLKLFVPYLNGQLHAVDLLAPHNEHRILFTRLMALSTLEVTGNWNVIVEMVIGAVLHALFLAQFIWLLRRTGIASMSALVAVFLLMLFLIPADIENTLGGFQSQFYALLICSAGGIVLLIERPVGSWSWCAGFLLAVLAYFSMAGGIFTPVAAGAVIAMQAVLRLRRPAAASVAIGLLAAMAVAMFAFTVHPAKHDALEAKSAFDFLRALSRSDGWPVPVPLIAPLLLNAPVLVLAGVAFVRRLPIGHPAWRVLALMTWVGLQGMSMAYARAAAPAESRYIDVLGLATLLNLAALCMILPAALNAGERIGGRVRVLAMLWVAVIGGSTVLAASRMVPRQVMADPAAVLARTANTTRYIRTGDPAALHQPFLHIPYYDAAQFADILSRPDIRGLLPAAYGVTPAEQQAVRGKLILHGGLHLEPTPAKRIAMAAGAVLMSVAMAGLAALIFLGQVPVRPGRR